jgi:peptidoglycan/LPS O-acetylase OafA/YrhL
VPIYETVRLRHVPALDALRGIAILLVLAVHTDDALPGGVLGVDLFFVLSGFLITSLLLNEWERDGDISFRSFYRRRALRLLPALFTMLAVVTVAAALTSNSFRTELTWVLYSVFYVTNVAAIRGDGIDAENLQHMWSLAAEEQFYLVWPVVLLFVLRGRVQPRTLVLVLASIGLCMIAWRTTASGFAGASPGYLFYAPETRSDGLVFGCIAGVAFGYGLVRRVPIALATVLLVPACFAVATIDLQKPGLALILLPLFCACATVALLTCALEPGWWFTRLIDRGWLRGLGRISYGLYLWHLPIYFAVGWKIGLPLAVLVALVSYRFVEQPFLRMRHRRGRGRASRVVSAGERPGPAPHALVPAHPSSHGDAGLAEPRESEWATRARAGPLAPGSTLSPLPIEAEHA